MGKGEGGGRTTKRQDSLYPFYLLNLFGANVSGTLIIILQQCIWTQTKKYHGWIALSDFSNQCLFGFLFYLLTEICGIKKRRKSSTTLITREKKIKKWRMREQTHPLPSKWICCSRKKKIPEQERKDWPFRIKWIAMHLFSILQIKHTKIVFIIYCYLIY